MMRRQKRGSFLPVIFAAYMTHSTFTEQAYLPAQAGNLPQGRWLILAPHADDETFGMGGAIALATQGGGVVDVLIMTDGARGGESPNLVATREDEARRATHALGCRKVDFLRQPDRALAVTPDLITQIAQRIAEEGYDAVFFPFPTEPHPDHRATAQIAWEALRQCDFHAQPISYEISTQGACNLLVDISSAVQQKIETMRMYGSQLTQNAYVDRIVGLNVARAWSLPMHITHAEAFYLWQAVNQPLNAQLWAIQYAQQSSYAIPATTALVSVIVRTKNRPAMLREAIRSIAQQTHPHIELLVINDGGDDVSTLIEEEAIGSIRRIHHLHNPVSLGRARAANLGLEHASGDFIGFLDDDDWLLPEHIQRLIAQLELEPTAVAAYSGVEMVRFENGHETQMHVFNDAFDPLRLAYNNFMPIHAVLFRRRAIERGCQFDEQLEQYEDWHFWLQLARLGTFAHVNEISAKYRMAQGSGSGSPDSAIDVSHVMNRFVEASRGVWDTNQLRHMCMSSMLVEQRGRDAEKAKHDLDQLKQHAINLELSLERLRDDITQLQKHAEDIYQDRQQLIRQQHEHIRHIDTLNALVAAKDHQISAKDHQISLWRERFDEVTRSRSWQLTEPLRALGRKARTVRRQAKHHVTRLRQESWRSILAKSHTIWRNEGFSGLLHRLRGTQEPTNAPLLTTQELPIAPHAHLVRSDGHYVLQHEPAGYQYIPPAAPLDLQEWLTLTESSPKFSIVVPVFKTPPGLLTELVESVLAQWYPDWELLLVDDASNDARLTEEIARFVDPRIRVLRLEQNQGIAAATNAGVQLAENDWIVFADHDDLLTCDCLYELARCIERDQPDFVYSDEDKLDEAGRFVQPHFKPEWSPDTMMSTMYTGHVSCVRKSLFDELGSLRSEFNGCQDWDFVLRLAERTSKFSHVPRVLYHWRIIPASIAASLSAKPHVLEASKKMREQALKRRNLTGSLEPIAEVPGYFRVNYAATDNPLISIIIPTRDHAKLLARCIQSIEQQSSYRNFEIIVLDNGSKDRATLSLLSELTRSKRARVIRHDKPFNFSELNNIGVQQALGDLLLFLNDDTKVVTRDWLERMAGYALLPHIGAVGAKLLYPSGVIQHSGVLNLGDGPGHAFHQAPARSAGYYMRNLLEYNWLAVTGACLMVEKEKFDRLGGFDENFPVAYNDVDLCFRLVDAGLYNTVCQSVELIHYESQTRGLDHLDADKRRRLESEKRRLYDKHPRYFQYDPFHSPNLHPNGIHFELLS